MSEEWDFYPLLVDDKPASIFLNLALRPQAPLSTHPTLGFVSLTMLRPRPDGLSSQEEFDDLVALEDEVIPKITAGSQILFVGRCTTGGTRDFYFYSPDASAFEIRARTAMIAFPGYTATIGAREDPAWSSYLNFLYPSPASMQRIMNRRVCDQLQKQGDSLTQPRLIDHFAYFSRAAQRAAFADFLLGERFVIGSAPDAPDEDGKYSIAFERQAHPAEIDDVVSMLCTKLAELDGDYDGWGCVVQD